MAILIFKGERKPKNNKRNVGIIVNKPINVYNWIIMNTYYNPYTNQVMQKITIKEILKDNWNSFVQAMARLEIPIRKTIMHEVERVIGFYNEVRQTQFTDPDEAAADFRKLAKEVARIDFNKSTMSRNTMANWLKSCSAPEHGPENRRRMFVVAFVLGLNPTIRGFNHKILILLNFVSNKNSTMACIQDFFS